MCKINAYFIYHDRLVGGRSFGTFALVGLYIPLFGKADIYLCWLKYICHWYFSLRMYILRSAWSSTCLSVNISPCHLVRCVSALGDKEVNSVQFAPVVHHILVSGKSILSSSWVRWIENNHSASVKKFSENSIVLTKILRSNLLYRTHL